MRGTWGTWMRFASGPRYVDGPVVVDGSDPYDLDSDGDGVACE